MYLMVIITLLLLRSLIYTPVYLNVTAFLQKITTISFELGSSLFTSFGNLGIAIGTFMGGKFISHYGIQYLPWLMTVFAILSLVLIYTVAKRIEKKTALR